MSRSMFMWDIKMGGFRVAMSNLLLRVTMRVVGAKSYRVSYFRQKPGHIARLKDGVRQFFVYGK